MKLGTLCYVKENGKTLMLHRVKKENDVHYGKWNGLGGKIEQGESPEVCVQREVLEESGLTITNPHFCGVMTLPDFHGEDWYIFIFTAREFTGELIDSPEGELSWIADEELLDLELWSSDTHFIPLLEKKLFSATFWYEGNELKKRDIVEY
ncbi:MAG: 8-oxo-dGTP diphosphatase [Candidatus Woesearchaeota archaeon]|nr:8-oxo-dGTP diphosphatase [Candidatus Woesearchaeota archaeon]